MIEYIKDINSFNIDQFHFLREEWLWAFIPMVIIAALIIWNAREDNKWKKVIAPALRPFMFTKEKRSGVVFPLVAFITIMSLCILAMAGPTWKKVDVAGAKSEAVLLIAFDASLSMMAEDIQPNRLERAKFKIQDLLDANPIAKTGLFVYAGTAHTVVPFCNDYNLITHHLQSLSPGIMPVRGSNLRQMLHVADSTLNKIEAPSTLLLVTDNIKTEDIDKLKDFVDNSIHRIEILAMATTQGAEIPKNKWKQPIKNKNGEVVISKLDTKVVFELQKHAKININTLTLDNSDMEIIAKNIRQTLTFQQDNEESEEQWQDMGYALVIVLSLLFPFWFRKGWMLQFCWLPFIILLSSCNTPQWKNLWYTDDYQGQKLYNDTLYTDAANTFESNLHKGVAYYKAGNFDAAAQAFEADSSANSLYNLSLAYSQMGEYDKAKEAIVLATKLEPNNEQFKETLAQTEELIILVDSLRTNGIPIQLPEKDEDQKGELNERKAASEDEELTSDTEVEELPEDGDRVTDQVETGERKAEELEEVPEDFEAGNENTPQNVLLRKISEDPSEFLRRRFKYQQKKYYNNQNELEEQW